MLHRIRFKGNLIDESHQWNYRDNKSKNRSRVFHFARYIILIVVYGLIKKGKQIRAAT